MGKNYPYSNGRIEPIGSCSPGTIHSYKLSDPSEEVVRQKRHYSDDLYIQNPLCSDESSLLSSTSSPVQTSLNASENEEKAEMNRSHPLIEDWPEVTPKPPPRTGKPDLEKLNELLSQRSKVPAKHIQPSKISQTDSVFRPSKVEVETIAIVHQHAENISKARTVENENSLKPVDQKKLRSKPPRKHKKTIEVDGCKEKSKPQPLKEKKEITKPEQQSHQGLITQPAYITTEIIEAEAENIEPELVERLEQVKPENVTERFLPDIVVEPEQVTVTANASLPGFVVEPENVVIPEILIESTWNDSESFTEEICNPAGYLTPEVTAESPLFSIHDTNDLTYDDDDRLSFISSLSLEYDGDNFQIKSPLSEDEASSLNHSKERIKPSVFNVSKADDDDIRWKEKTDHSTYKFGMSFFYLTRILTHTHTHTHIYIYIYIYWCS